VGGVWDLQGVTGPLLSGSKIGLVGGAGLLKTASFHSSGSKKDKKTLKQQSTGTRQHVRGAGDCRWARK